NQARQVGASLRMSQAMVAGKALLSARRLTRHCVLTTIRCVSLSAPPGERVDPAGARFVLSNLAGGLDVTELGLGYMLCQRIVQLHGGDIYVERMNASEHATGTRGVFHLLLPTEGGTSRNSARKRSLHYAREKGDDSRGR